MTDEHVLLRLHSVKADLERSLSEISRMIKDMRSDKESSGEPRKNVDSDSFSEDKESFIAP